ncbi:MAG: DNA N-6-adenine-methyltransferase [Nanoarchaeota archaeon]
MNKGLFTSKTGEWETPQWLFDQLNKKFRFDIDVCATKKNAKCKKFYTKKDAGLKMGWYGNVWCNPPYGREIKKWVEKAFLESHKGIIVMLLPARTDTKWFHNWLYKKRNIEIIFIKGRLKFGNSKNSAPFPSMIVIIK